MTNVWNLSLSDRWSLYRRWVKDVRERYRRTISYLHREFEWSVERLKEAKTMQDLEILERADVIGMTTTGELQLQLYFLHKNCPALYSKLKTCTAACS